MKRVLLFLALSALPAAADPPQFELRGTWDSDAFRRTARRTLESAWTVYQDLGRVRPDHDTPYRFHVYASRSEYLEADHNLTSGRFALNGGFFCLETGESHLLFAPRTEEDYSLRTPLTERMRALLVHEGSHMFWRRHVKWTKGAPQWAQEGLAELCAEREMGEGASRGVYFSTASHLLSRAIESGRLLPLEDVLGLDMSTSPDAYARDLYYRESWALVKWLTEEKPAEWNRLIAAFGESDEALAGPHGRAVFRREVGEVRAVEKEWVAWMKKLPRGAWEMRYGDWMLDGGELEGTAYPGTGSAVFHEQEIDGPVEIRAEVRIQDLGERQADILVGCWDDRGRNFVKVAFCASGLTAVLLLRDDAWTRVFRERKAHSAIPCGKWTAIRVVVEGRTLQVFVGDAQVGTCEITDPDVRLDGRWGFGNYDSSVRFRNWKVEVPE